MGAYLVEIGPTKYPGLTYAVSVGDADDRPAPRAAGPAADHPGLPGRASIGAVGSALVAPDDQR